MEIDSLQCIPLHYAARNGQPDSWWPTWILVILPDMEPWSAAAVAAPCSWCLLLGWSASNQHVVHTVWGQCFIWNFWYLYRHFEVKQENKHLSNQVSPCIKLRSVRRLYLLGPWLLKCYYFMWFLIIYDIIWSQLKCWSEFCSHFKIVYPLKNYNNKVEKLWRKEK